MYVFVDYVPSSVFVIYVDVFFTFWLMYNIYIHVDQYLSKWYEDIQVHLHNMNIKHNLYLWKTLSNFI